MAYIIKTDGTEVEIGSQPDLDKLQKAVGGYIELVSIDGSAYFYANEEGLLLGLPLNSRATMLVNRPIVGDIVMMEPGDE